jgi:hypothetical protein
LDCLTLANTTGSDQLFPSSAEKEIDSSYITKIGSIPDHFWQGAVYKYTLSVSAD